MFEKILIANRGEIACRVIRTARRMGIRTVAVYSEADARALHVELADEAYPIGPPPARESYLHASRILDAALRSGAQAIHPGYGFLSENADFAAACVAAGITFIGPPASAIRAMGLKSAAKELMQGSGVPVVPGYHGAAQDLATLAAAAERTGYPALIKASAGGGGKGMRVVERPEDLAAAIASAKREAASSFGDDRLLVEKYLTRPRHIEIQVFADTHGHAISLFERDCSIQRRHQKVIEEAPAPGMDPARRKSMGEAACAAARAIGYVSAGTVEFIVEGDDFYFMEMNTRLQVEHPVTEFITGLDLVEWQLRVAAGEPLPKRAEELEIHGHAIEARIYAEDPAHDFRPSIGRLWHLKAPAESEHVRVDTGVRAGDAVIIDYDPMIAKLIVWDQDRESAVRRLRMALAEYQIAGVTNNVALLSSIAGHAAFAAGKLDTGFIARHAGELMPPFLPASREVLSAAVLKVLSDQQREARERAAASADRWSPWNQLTSWRLNGEGYQDLLFQEGESRSAARVRPRGDDLFQLELPDGEMEISGSVKTHVSAVRQDDEIVIFSGGLTHHLRLIDLLASQDAEEATGGRLTAPMPGRIVQVLTEKGATVKRGDALLILEAMKMEYTIAAPSDGQVEEVRYAAGDVVDEGAELITFHSAAE
ncbi:MAG TPA: acetyl/propionyl/methylcrotonyl-CoA carboxylase subunit alpha [Bryobacteraceae bacterium]|jgi:3-methylcrotonyl-CoA carboxylase alpha subunit|nr:acetyl/propionyl/methylcrotonyl-CoA carboxylase subunit alpha [Bryobacteraceae bacterium]